MASVTILSDNGATSGSAGLKTSGGNDGVLILQTTTSGGTATNAVTIDTNQNVGVGISSIPNYNSNLRTVSFNNTSGVVHDYCVNGTRTGSFVCQSSGFDLTTQTAIPLIFSTNATERMRLDSSGNLGLGVTPSAWNVSAKALQIGAATMLGDWIATTNLANNYVYLTGGDYYLQNGYASYYSMSRTSGNHTWSIAGSGTGGTTISWTQAMTLNASGNLLLGGTSATQNGYFTNFKQSAVLSMGTTPRGKNFSITYESTPVASTTVTSWRCLDAQGNVYGTNCIVGHFYIYVRTGAGGDGFTAVYSVCSNGNGAAGAALTLVQRLVRGTDPQSSIAVADDGVGGAIKLNIAYNSAVTAGYYTTVSFVGVVY